MAHPQRTFIFTLLVWFFVAVLLLGGGPRLASAQLPSATPSPSARPSPTASPTPSPSPSAIPVPTLVTSAATAEQQLQAMQDIIHQNTVETDISERLTVLEHNVQMRTRETERMTTLLLSLDSLRTEQRDWQNIAAQLDDWAKSLTARATLLSNDLSQLAGMRDTWQATAATARSAGVPADVQQQIDTLVAHIERMHRELTTAQAAVLTLQNRVITERGEVEDELALVKKLRTRLLDRLLQRDNEPLWRGLGVGLAGAALATWKAMCDQAADLDTYLQENVSVVVAHTLIFCFCWLVLRAVSRKTASWERDDEGLRPAAAILSRPFWVALLMSLFLASHMYVSPPDIVVAVIGAAALLPTILLLRAVVDRSLHPALYALMALYFLDRVHEAVGAAPAVSRLVLLAEVMAALLFIAWQHRLPREPADEQRRVWQVTHAAYRLVAFGLAVSLVANVLGYVALAWVLAHAMLASANTAVIMFAAVDVMDALTVFALHLPAVQRLRSIESHEMVLRVRLRLLYQWLAALVWLLITLDIFNVGGMVAQWLDSVLSSNLHLGALQVTLGSLLAFGVTIWASFMVSRALRWILDEDVYPRVHLRRGLPFAINTLLHYLVLLLGFFFAIAMLGIDMTRLVVLASAFSVGIGFGLQTVVNNFVSGLILLFERPIKVGDIIQLGDTRGTVENIGIRATLVRTWDAGEVVVPNSILVSQQFTNWTFSNVRRGIEMTVRVHADVEPARVIDVLRQAAEKVEGLLRDPAPEVVLDSFGKTRFTYRVRAWTNLYDQTSTVRSELALRMREAMRSSGLLKPVTDDEPKADVEVDEN
jgi:small-conductance mechanosensitive channel